MYSITFAILAIAVLSFPYVLFYLYFNKIENRAKKTIETLPKNAKAQFLNVRVWFKDFNIKKKVFKIDPFKTLYYFNIADLYVLNDKLVIIGKTKMRGRMRILSPFAICWFHKELEQLEIKYLTRYISTEIVGNDIEIQFEDAEYLNNIKIVIKKIGKILFNEIKDMCDVKN